MYCEVCRKLFVTFFTEKSHPSFTPLKDAKMTLTTAICNYCTQEFDTKESNINTGKK